MAVARRQTRVVVAHGDPGRVRYSVTLTSEDCPKGTIEAATRQRLFMHWLADNPDLLRCGLAQWERITGIFHNGICWQLNCEAEVDEDTEDGD